MRVKEKILTTATRLFHGQGYNSTGINQIIEESGIARGSFYYNFKSKEDLCVSYLVQRHEYWFGALKKHIHSKRSSQPKVLSAFDFLAKMNEQENFRGCSFLNLLSEISHEDVKILAVIQEHKNDLRELIKSLVDHQVADHVYLLFESALIESQLFRDQWPVQKAKNIVESLI